MIFEAGQTMNDLVTMLLGLLGCFFLFILVVLIAAFIIKSVDKIRIRQSKCSHVFVEIPYDCEATYQPCLLSLIFGGYYKFKTKGIRQVCKKCKYTVEAVNDYSIRDF
jgi:hypothetical protein